MNQIIRIDAGMSANMLQARAEPDHILGPVADDWEAAEVWLTAVRLKSRNGGAQTIATYRHHLAKLRWYCEYVAGMTPSRWSLQDVERFIRFLAAVPIDALCANGAVAGEVGWTPFQRQPSTSSQADIRRCVHAMFGKWHDAGYIRINPMALIGAGSARSVNVQRAVAPDLIDQVLDAIEREDKCTFTARQLALRDRFIFEAVRGMGLRSSELVQAQMNAFYPLSVPKTGYSYWVFHVTAETGKGGRERRIPVPHSVWEAFTTYRRAFGLSAMPASGDTSRLLLSPRTHAVMINNVATTHTGSRRFFNAWRAVTSRKSLYAIVKGRFARLADTLEQQGDGAAAELLRRASTHWIRHTFAKSALLSGHGMRDVANLLGHASMDTTMIYTDQDAQDAIAAWERVNPGNIAQEKIIARNPD